MNYEKLVEALLMGADYGVEEESVGKLCADAAAAIEELQADQKKTVTQIFCEEQAAWEGRCKDLMKQISELQAKISELGESYSANLVAAQNAQPHWVSVEERLPEVGQLILLYYGGCFSIAARTEDEMYEGKRYWKLEDGYWERIEDDYYWMPIEPPQEDA